MKQLRLSNKDRKIAGVCGGLAEYFGLDPTIVRVMWLCCVILAGFGFLAYLICWFVIPRES
ncbi:MAG: PspC domain-containing protein [Fibromonadales bacterium]|nr:PspC domain-containing protein [Fibromonadales bacterium]